MAPVRSRSLWVLFAALGVSFLMVPLCRAQGSPENVLKAYTQALYARDFEQAYPLLSEADRKLKSKEEYLRENPPFQGFALQAARKLASYIDYEDIHVQIQGTTATVKVRWRLPSGNAPEIRSLLQDWDEDRLSTLSKAEQEAILEKLEALRRSGKFPMLEGEDSFELLREAPGWRVFLNWGGAIKVIFRGEAKMGLPWEFYPVQEVVLARPGETLRAIYRAKNLADRTTEGKARHLDEPKELAEKYLEMVQCFCFIQQALEPGEEKEFPLLFRVKEGVPEDVKSFQITYEFYPLEHFRGEWEQEEQHGHVPITPEQGR